MNNPWQVNSIEAFKVTCFKCPQCGSFTFQRNIFTSHAIKNHPLSLVLFGDGGNLNSQNNNQERICNENTEPMQIDPNDTTQSDSHENLFVPQPPTRDGRSDIPTEKLQNWPKSYEKNKPKTNMLKRRR